MHRWALWTLIALSAALASGLLPAARAQGGPPTITLSGPTVCETDRDYFFSDTEIDTVPITWTVNGGAPPYEILINGELFNQPSGQVEIPCGKLRDQDGTPRVTSGITTVQAAVTDAAGRSAAALHDLYAIRIIHSKGRIPPLLRGGETYRIHGLLLTMPRGLALRLDAYLSQNCPTRDETCRDRFRLDSGATDISIYRWSRTEHSRSFHDASRGIHLNNIRPGDDIEIPHRFQQINDRYDELLASIGQPPNHGYTDARPGGPAGGRMSLTLEMPAICNSVGTNVPVAWTVSGGRAPYQVTIEGTRYLGQRGVADLNCAPALGKPQDSGRRRVQATAVGANGDTASARADLYIIQPRYSWRLINLTPGATYRGPWGLITIPHGVEAAVDRSERDFCTDPWPTESSNCEPGTVLSISINADLASIAYGNHSGREYSRTIAADAPPALAAKFDELLASIGAPPQLPPDFVDASGPLRLTVFTDPPMCERNNFVSLHRTVAGGRWWPLQVEVDGMPPGFGSNFSHISCGDEPAIRQVQLRLSENGPNPRAITQSHTINIIADPRGFGWLRPPDDPRCVVGQPFELNWNASGAAADTQFIVALDGVETTVSASKTFQLRCAAIAGTHLITVRPANAASPQPLWSAVVYAVNAHPERTTP